MVTEEFWINSSKGDIKLHCVKWLPDNGTIRMVLQIMHGMTECMELYDEFSEYFTSHDVAVVGHDFRGHGYTGPVLGVIAEENGHVEMVNDAFEVTRAIESEFPGVPIFLMGFSMGSFVARRLMTLHPRHYKGVAILGTANPSRSLTTAVMSGLKGLERIYGPHEHPPSVVASAGQIYNIFGKYKENENWVSTDPEIIKRGDNNPKCNFQFSIGALIDLGNLIQELIEKKDFKYIPQDLPVIFMSGADDPLSSKGENVIKSAKILEKYGLKPEVILYEGELHIFARGKPAEKSLPDLLDWLNRVNNQ